MVITSEAVFAAVAEIMAAPWKWGAADCCTAACDVFRRLHGFDPMAGVRGQYASERAALRYVAASGGDFERAIAAIIEPQGFGRSDMACPGDLALVPQPGAFGAAVAICVAPNEFAAKTETGHAIITRSKVVWACRRL